MGADMNVIWRDIALGVAGAAIFLGAVAGCTSSSTPPSTPAEEIIQRSINSKIVAVVDGCDIWQIQVPGRYVYMARCHDDAKTVGTTYRTGGKIRHNIQLVVP